MRKSYERSSLERSDLLDSPIELFRVWWQDALDAGNPEPNAMTLSTASIEGRPSARTVLLKGIVEDQFVFYTNYQSRKAEEMAKNPQACLLFWWPEIERQVRLEGRITKTDENSSTDYFQSRPRGSQLGAWASNQSRPIESRDALVSKLEEVQNEYAEKEVIPKPDFWGGYQLIPDYFEFWQGRSNRLHDRFCYQLLDDRWNVMRLQP